MDFNSQDSARQVEYLVKRIENINQSLQETDSKIQTLVSEEKKTETTTKTHRFWFLFSTKTSTTVETKPDLQSLQDRKNSLLAERENLERTIKEARENNNNLSTSISTDISLKQSKLDYEKENLTKAKQNYLKKREDLLTHILEADNVDQRSAKQFSMTLTLLNFVSLKAISILSELHSAQSIIKLALANEKLKPANVLTTISNIFQYNVMSEILNTGLLLNSKSTLFNSSYIQFMGESQSTQILAIELAPPAVVQEQDTIMAQKKVLLAQAGWT